MTASSTLRFDNHPPPTNPKKREEKELSEYASYWKNLLYIHSFRNINQHILFSAGKTVVQGSSHNKVPNEYSMIALLKDKIKKTMATLLICK